MAVDDRTAEPGSGSAGGVLGSAGRALLAVGGLVRRAEVSPDGRALYQIGGRDADTFYRDRWSYDKVVRSTHGVNCTGSCS
jgi:nitrate reductase alpha subunit